MFPRLRQKVGTALVDRIDVLVEFSTLGEYALADDLLPVEMHGDDDGERYDEWPHVAAWGNAARLTGAVAPAATRSRDQCPARGLPVSGRCSD